MAGFGEWIFENLQIATIATALVIGFFIETEFSLLMQMMALVFIVFFLITCLVRFVSILIYNIRLAE